MNHYRYDDIYVGLSESFSVEITQQMLDSFKDITGDINSLHCNEKFAVENGWGGGSGLWNADCIIPIHFGRCLSSW